MNVLGLRRTKLVQTLIITGAIFGTLFALPTPQAAYQDATEALAADGLDYANQLAFAIATLALWLALSWLAIIAICALISWAPGYVGALGRRACIALTPAIAQRALATVLGVGLVIAGPTAASATDTPAASLASQQQSYDLDWPTQPKPTTYNLDWPAQASATEGEVAPTTHTVAQDETLWSIAETHLPAGASDADIAQAWPSWWQANRDVIGEDPDHITPGQQLKMPENSDRQ